MHPKIFRFFNALREQLQNCQLVLNQSEFFPKLLKAGHSTQFFEFFHERCFSLLVQDIPHSWRRSQQRTDDLLFATRWPLWAIFNNIFLPNCRELTLPYNLLRAEEMGVEAANWLMHPSTEQRPRLLKLHAPVYWLGDGFVTMLQHIKEVNKNK